MDTIRLDNGLRCIFEQRKGAGVVSIQFWVEVGSKYEESSEAGITHFIEHLIFKGTEKAGRYEVAPMIEALGGSINAFTSYDNTVYHIVVPAAAFETGLNLLASAVVNPLFPQDELEKEKRVVIEEIKMGEDDPQRKLFKELFSLSYAGHPYGRPVIGFQETVAAATREDILRYFARHYRPENIVAVIVGDFDSEQAKELLADQFAVKSEMSPQPAWKAAKATKGRDSVVIEKNVSESYLAIAYPIPPLDHRDIPALEVLGKILGEGDSSRLQANLKYRQALITGGEAYLFTPREDGLMVVAATFKGRDHEAVRKGIESELERIFTKGIEPWELEKAKNQEKASFVYSAETVQGRAREIGYYETLTHDPHFAEKYLKRLDRLTEADVRKALEKYVRGKERATAVVLPKGDSGKDAQDPSTNKRSNPRTISLPNGLSCVLNSNTSSPSFAFMIGFVGGSKEEAPGKTGTFNLLSRMLLKGTKQKDSQAIARQIDTLAGGISPVSGRNVFGLQGKFLSKDFKEVMGLLRELVRETELRSDELKKVKNEVLSDIRQRDDDPGSYAFLQMNATLYEGHAYGKDVLGTEAEVRGSTLQDLKNLYRGYVTPDHAVLAISGDIDFEDVERLVGEAFADWKGPARELKEMRYKVSSSQDKYAERDILQTHLIYSFTGPGLIDEERYPNEVLNAVLSGMGGRIFKRLRDENPFAYAATFFEQMAYEVSALGIYVGTDKTHVPEIDSLVRKEIETIRKDGFTGKEVADAKQYLIGNHYTRMQTNGAITYSMCLDAIYGLGPGNFKVWPKKIEAVTLDQANEAARKNLVLDKMVKVTVGPK
jgi:zinc protease